MDFAITFRGDHVHVELSGEPATDPQLPGEYWNSLRRICDEYRTRRILVEGVAPASVRGPADVIAAGERAATVPNLWLAFHLDNFEPTEMSELYEVVAASHGVRVKFFDNADEALNWLRANAPS
ncbi:MAG TPA: hypothetical protein VFZ23_17515 [Pyrinomonadaceae bacterium]